MNVYFFDQIESSAKKCWPWIHINRRENNAYLHTYAVICTGIHTHAHRETQTRTHTRVRTHNSIWKPSSRAERRTGKSYCHNAHIINHLDVLLALSLYMPLKWCLAQIVRGQTLNRAGLKCTSQTSPPIPSEPKFPAQSAACVRLREINCLKGVINTFADEMMASD